MSDLFTFRRMLAPIVIQVLFILASLGSIIGGIAILMHGAVYSQPATTTWLGVGFLLLGPILVRLYAEAVIVIFRINETLTDIRSLAVWAADVSSTQAEAD
jgi:hypothetical protein